MKTAPTALFTEPRRPAMTALILNPPTATPPFYARTTVDHGRFDFGATGYGSCPWECAANAVGGALDWLERLETPHLLVYRTRDGEAFIAEHGPWSAIDRCPIEASAAVLEAVADAQRPERADPGAATWADMHELASVIVNTKGD